MEKSRIVVCVIGNLPPRVSSGQALVNASFAERLAAAGASVKQLDLSPYRGLSNAGFLRRSPNAIAAMVRLVRLCWQRRMASVYIGLSGGYGQLYDALYVLICRLSGVRLVLHHDSYKYLARQSRLTDTVIRLAGQGAVHVVCCDDMSRRLQQLYSTVRHVVVISNTTNIDLPTQPRTDRRSVTTIGLISFLSRAKGAIEFMDVADRVHAWDPGIRAIMAGPIVDDRLRPTLEARLLRSPWIQYLGPVSGSAKDQFFRNIDVLVFPTQYVNEADPRVVSEALSQGAAVIAFDRGCIGSLLEAGGGSIVKDEQFIDAAERWIRLWQRDPNSFARVCSRASSTFAVLRELHGKRLNALIRWMVDPTATALE